MRAPAIATAAPAFFSTEIDIDRLCEVVGELWPEKDDRYRSTLQIGGYCRNAGTSDDPHTQMSYDSVRSRGADLPIEERLRLQHEEEHQLVRQWLPLAQFPTQSEVYYGCFLLRAEDLAAQRFDQMRSYTMFTE
ncbi:hypothetical protein [Lentzea sp. NBRC 102530]|uniref:hypothetical protein n=1 Tax=Lentzea sp. NBRC 102530 TaxID=3032201 RepID=UPI0024A53F85|nr:hypothetical protein [Lentzea sp. NBRC 102530]GLY50340.1 hypothetical protein Lesp01_39960 [Lentzea sp. NBRC 102530]